MSGIHPSVMTHKMAIFKEAKPIAQKKRRMGAAKATAAQEEVEKMTQAGFIREVTYTT